MQNKSYEKKVFIAICALVICCALLFSIFYLKSLDKWWYEDDPIQFFYVSKILNIFQIFFDPNTLRNFGTGASIVPMQLVSYWVDVKFFGISPLAVNIHNLISFVVVTCLIFIVLVRFTKNVFTSAIISLLWIFLPTTIAVHYFTACRHYLEGLGWSLLACYWVYSYCDNPAERRKNVFRYIGIIICTILAMLSKEIYVASLLSFLFLYSSFKKRFALGISSIALGLAFVIYRSWIIGGGRSYPLPLLDFGSFLQFLALIPYTFTANTGGYIVYSGLFICCIILLTHKPYAENLKLVLGILVVIISALAAIYPTAFAVLQTFKTPGTWYRSPFILSTLVLLAIGYLLTRITKQVYQLLFLACMALILLPGTQKTHLYWMDRLARSEQEGKFYLANPGKLLYSEEAASWFIPGVSALYNVSQAHYINMQFDKSEHSKEMLNLYPTIWRFRNGNFVEDNQLYKKIKKKNDPAP